MGGRMLFEGCVVSWGEEVSTSLKAKSGTCIF